MSGAARLSFWGGVGTVTGSRFLLRAGGARILVECGLFQGFKQLRLKNWAPFPLAPSSIQAVVLTHAHLDHSGALPLLVRQGFRGPILCTPPTRDLCGVLLPDSGALQERDAEFANRHGFSKHHPALPLYTRKDAEACLPRLRPVRMGEAVPLPGGCMLRFHPAGHILGAAMAEIRLPDGRSILFSGDLGRPRDPLMPDPARIERADWLLVESTYGDRRHPPDDPEEALAEVIRTTAARGGTVVVPAFAVGRTQSLLWHLSRLKAARRIPDIPVFLDSPMAQEASDIFTAHPDAHRLTHAEAKRAFAVARYVRDAEESKALDNPVPKVIISAAGMATGGRVLHHLKAFGPDRRNTILLTGFQAGGTRGAALLAGAEAVKIHGAYVPIRAEVRHLDMLSAHADAEEIMAWLKGFRAPPRRSFVIHGEPAAADALRHRIEEELGWPALVPAQGDTAELA
ncbi:MAG: MBL fold metallo-hydrolase [Acetobacteraceae bacterium]|nr:MBL fold metallo-hydrolase [Acetobacteraceae bacterium]